MGAALDAPNNPQNASEQPAPPPSVDLKQQPQAPHRPTSLTDNSGALSTAPPLPSTKYPENHVPRSGEIPLPRVQTFDQDGLGSSAHQLGHRARRARECELHTQSRGTPKSRTSSSTIWPDLSSYALSHASQPSVAPAPGALLLPTPPSHNTEQQEDGDDDGEGELEEDLASQSIGYSVLSESTPAVPPHTVWHLIPPIAVLAPSTTPSRASLAQRARRERERADRRGGSPDATGGADSPSTSSSAQPTNVAQPPISYEPVQQLPPGSTHIAALDQFPQQPPKITRAQLAQRARRTREHLERVSKFQNSKGWISSLNSHDGVSSTGEAFFPVAPPLTSVNGTTVFATTAIQHNPGYGVGLGENHIPQQLNRAQLAQRARRARERQHRLSSAGAHASSSPLVGENGSLVHHRSPSSSVPPTSPTAKRHMGGVTWTSLPSNVTGGVPAQLSIGVQFVQVFKLLTAGDDGGSFFTFLFLRVLVVNLFTVSYIQGCLVRSLVLGRRLP
jgi:hypothetical protein